MSGADLPAVVEDALSEHFGQRPSRASISFLGVEPIDVLRFEPIPGERAYLSLGMSRRPMTAATEFVVGADGPRAELMLHVRDDSGRYGDVWRQLALLAASPAVEGVVYTPGMTVDLGQPLVAGSRCTGVVVAESALAPIDTFEGAVAVLQVLPATSTELAWCRVQGAAALRERWVTQLVDLLDLGRRAVALD
jgi:Suppressor of fused protein (SUFU)